MAILSNGKFYGFLCSVKATGRKLSNGVKEYVEDFVSGFAGHGWKLWEYIKGKWKLEIDSLVVRETMVVFELLIQKIRAVKGALGITQACGRIKTATLDESGQNWLVTIEDEMSFVAHDFIRCQDWTNGTLKGYWVEIAEIRKIDGVDTIVIPVSEFTGGIGYTDGMEAVDPALSGMTTPAVSDEIVQFGNSKDVNRQSAIYLHADEGGQPAIDILFGINSKSFAGCTKIRMGGDIPGTDGLKGFYCENGMIKGTDSTGHVVYCIYPDGTAEFGDGSAKFATDKSGYIAGGAISWHWDASKNKYVCSMKGVVLTWDNLDEETKENLKGEDGKDGLSITWKGDLSSAPSNPEKNWAYRNTSNGIVYIYNGSAWELMVADGQDGTDGTDGTDGLSVFVTYHDSEDEPSRPTGSGTSGGWHTNATKDVVWISQKVASSASSGTWGDPIRFKGLPGKYTELRYKYAFGKPATPTGTNPAGWSLSPDREDITFSYSGNFTKDGDYYVSPSPTSHSSTYKQRVSFTTRRANQMIHIEIDVSSEQNYDKGIVEALDTSYHMDNEHAWEGSGVTNAVVDIAVPTAGSHFVEIVYTKDGSISSNKDRVKFRMLDPTTCWYSTAVIDGETSPSWSEPVIFPTDSKTEEQVYLLAKSKRNVIDLPTSNEYVNEYIGDAPEYSSSKFYSAGNIVKYNNVYKVAIQAHSGIAPTNEAYWEDVLWWVDNPRGASETYPYEYTCERTLQDGKWGEYKNYHLFGHYGKDGEPGADGKDANLLPWVEQWNNNKTLIDGEYIVSPKMFSGTKDSGGKLTGIALGRDCITVDGEKRTGIFALVGGNIVFKLDPISEEYEFQGSVVADSITMKDFAHLSQAIFKGDFMFSQQGIDADGNPTSNYQEFNQENPQGGNFKPNLAFNLKTGDQYSNGGHVYGFATNTPIQANGASVDPDKVAYSKVNILFSGTSSLRLPNDKKFDGVEFTIVNTASRSFDGSANIYREGGGDTNYSATGIHYKGVEIRTCYMRSEGSFIRLIAHWNGSKLKYYVVGHSDNFAMIEPILNTQGISATLGIWFVDRAYTSSTSMRVYYNDINLFLFMLNVYSGKDAPNTGGLNFTSPSS